MCNHGEKIVMNVGTISLNINAPDFNYGAILHSWAFQQFLLSIPEIDSAEIIDYTMPILEGQNLKFPFLFSIKKLNIKAAVWQIMHYKNYLERYNKFQKFIATNMTISKARYTHKSLNDANLSYDVIFCESDVIWSPGFSGGHFDSSFFLALESMKDMKRIAYAPSMSDGNLTIEQEEELYRLLKFPQYISCRESYEKFILEKYTDKKVTHVLDPVLLLDDEDYEKIVSNRTIKNNYLLLYLPVDDNNLLRKAANDYALKKGLTIVDLSTHLKKNKNPEITSVLAAGVEDFLSLIKYASCIFTNSFHAICFSIIFKKDFYAFSRNFAGKVIDICKSFHLEERYIEDGDFSEKPPIDYKIVYEILYQKKKESKEWIMKCFNNN